MNSVFKKSLTIFSGFTLLFAAAGTGSVKAAGADETTVLVTEYADLWTGNISVKVGDTVKWYVNVPEDVTPKGCGATIKIPDLGWGTDSHNKEEGHLTLVQGENYVYEFTPENTGDILFTCWMGSGCHHNYIHVTEDGTYSAQKPADPAGITAAWHGNSVNVEFTDSETPEGASITGYKVTATDEDGVRKKVSVKKSPAVFEELDSSRTYTISVVAQATSGNSTGENNFVLAPSTLNGAVTETVTLKAEEITLQTEAVKLDAVTDAVQAGDVTTAAETLSGAVSTEAITTSETTAAETTTTSGEVTTTSNVTTTAAATTSAAATTKVTAQNVQTTPKTGSSGIIPAEIALGFSGILSLLAAKNRKKK